MNLGDNVNLAEGTAAVLLCARCKQAVPAGSIHNCKESKDENQPKDKEE